MNVVLLWLTKQYLRLIDGKFLRIEVIKLLDEEKQEVIVISSDKWPLLGQRTLFGTTIIHESAFSTERLLNYVFIHEIGHKKQWYGFLIYPLIVVCMLGAMAFFLMSLLSLLASLIFLNPSYLLTTLFALCFMALSFAILGIFSWALELDAEFYAIRKLGLWGVLAARADIPKSRKFPWYLRALGLLTHPSTGLTIRIYHWTHRKQQLL